MANIYLNQPNTVYRWSQITTGSGAGGLPSTSDYIYVGSSTATGYADAPRLIIDVDQIDVYNIYVGYDGTNYCPGILEFEDGHDFVANWYYIYVYSYGYIEANGTYTYAQVSSTDATTFTSTGAANETCYFPGFCGGYVEVGNATDGYSVWYGARDQTDLTTKYSSFYQGISTVDPTRPLKKMQMPALTAGTWYDMGFYIPKFVDNGGVVISAYEYFPYSSNTNPSSSFMSVPILFDVFTLLHFGLTAIYTSTSVYNNQVYLSFYNSSATPNTTKFGLGKNTYQFTLAADILATDTTITVNESLANLSTDGRTSGFISIDDEIIYYDSLDTTNNQFLGCVRGIGNTTAASHLTGATVAEGGFLYYPETTGDRLIQKITFDTDAYSPGVTYMFGDRDGVDPATDYAAFGEAYWKHTKKLPAGYQVRKPNLTIRSPNSATKRIYVYNNDNPTALNMDSVNPQVNFNTVLCQWIYIQLSAPDNQTNTTITRKLNFSDIWLVSYYNNHNQNAFIIFDSYVYGKDFYFEFNLSGSIITSHNAQFLASRQDVYSVIYHVNFTSGKLVSVGTNYQNYTTKNTTYLIPLHVLGNNNINIDVEILCSKNSSTQGIIGFIYNYTSHSFLYPLSDFYTELSNLDASPGTYTYPFSTNISINIYNYSIQYTPNLVYSITTGNYAKVLFKRGLPVINVTINLHSYSGNSILIEDAPSYLESLNITVNPFNTLYFRYIISGYLLYDNCTITINSDSSISAFLTYYGFSSSHYTTQEEYNNNITVNLNIPVLYCYNSIIDFSNILGSCNLTINSNYSDIFFFTTSGYFLSGSYNTQDYLYSQTFGQVNITLTPNIRFFSNSINYISKQFQDTQISGTIYVNKFNSFVPFTATTYREYKYKTNNLRSNVLIDNMTIITDNTLYNVYSYGIISTLQEIPYPWLRKNDKFYSTGIQYLGQDSGVYKTTPPSLKFQVPQGNSYSYPLFYISIKAGDIVSIAGSITHDSNYFIEDLYLFRILDTYDNSIKFKSYHKDSNKLVWQDFNVSYTSLKNTVIIFTIYVPYKNVNDFTLYFSDFDIQVNGTSIDVAGNTLYDSQTLYEVLPSAGGSGGGSGGGGSACTILKKQMGALRALNEKM